MTLTNTAVRYAKPDEKSVKMFDERGLFKVVIPDEGKWWRLRYKFDTKEKLLSLGTYPGSERREAARQLVAANAEPVENLKKSTGPKSKAGKATVSANTYKSGT